MGLSTDASAVAGEKALRMEHQASQVLAVRGGMHSQRGRWERGSKSFATPSGAWE